MSSSHSHSIKQQFERILKDTKILCELEPFVKKWSLEETLPNLTDADATTATTSLSINEEDAQYNKISSILKTKQDILSNRNPSDNNERENMLRKIKESLEIITPPKSNNEDHNNSIPFHQSHNSLPLDDENMLGSHHHDHELEKTFKMLEAIEEMDAVLPIDIEEYNRGLGGKPDGPDLHKTTIREWKSIFMEHWLFLNQSGKCQKKMLGKLFPEKGSVQQGIGKSTVYANPISLLERNADLDIKSPMRKNLDSHFTTRKGYKSIPDRSCTAPATQQQPYSTYLPTLPQKKESKVDEGKRKSGSSSASLMHLQNIEKDKKIASSANKGARMSHEYEKVLAKSPKQGVTSLNNLLQRRRRQPSHTVEDHVNKNNQNMMMSRPLPRSSTAVKTNIEIQRLTEKVRPSTRPFTSISSYPMKATPPPPPPLLPSVSKKVSLDTGKMR